MRLGAKLPCVQWREPRFRSRYAHSDRLAAEWDLEVYDWTPLAYALTDGYDIETGQPRFDFVKCYEMAPRKVMFLCLGTEEPKAEELASGRYLCGLGRFAPADWDVQLPLGRCVPWPKVVPMWISSKAKCRSPWTLWCRPVCRRSFIRCAIGAMRTCGLT
jgi:hypothetical protein